MQGESHITSHLHHVATSASLYPMDIRPSLKPGRQDKGVCHSLVPRLPRSGMQTLKLCRRGEPGIFSHVRSGKGRHEVDATLIVCGRMSLRTEKGTKIAGNLLHVSSYRASNIIQTER